MNTCLHGKTAPEVCEMNMAGQMDSELSREFESKRGPLGPVHVNSIGHEEKTSRNLRLRPMTSCNESSEPSQGQKRRHHTRRSDQKSTRMLKLPKLTNQIHVIANITLLLVAGALIKVGAGHAQELAASDSINFHDERLGGGSSYSMLSSGTNTENSHGDGKSSEPNEENEEELDFKLMNAAHDRLQAVRSLLNATRQQTISSSGDADDQSLQGRAASANGSSLHCAHKGRHYANGQMVPIEDQPCLNCTCRTAVLQCYLRVCPPIVSLEAHRQRLISSGRALASDQECRMLRTPGECCPSMRCGDELLALGTTNEPEARNVAGAPSAQAKFQSANEHHHLVAAGSSRIPQPKDHHQLAADQSRGGDQLQSASSIVQTTTTTIMPFDNLPKLTVINGPAGQRDSILLITSNPQAISLNGSSFGGRQHASKSNDSSSVGDNGAQGDHQRQLVSSAPIIEALLETIYSSAAKQLSGLNLQGSCMINGSLYFEGSAVLPESGSGQCQYCYCIRQKVMCVRPRCHLIISGCTPKYNNEFACCPTSYNCQQNSLASGRDGSTAPLNGSALARLTSLSGAPSSSELLQARLSAVLEAALARVTRDQRHGAAEQPLKLLNSAAGELDADEPLTARQIDGGQQVAGKQERNNLIDLFSILDDRQAEPGPSQSTPSTTTSTTTTTTARPITTTSSTTTTLAPTTSTTTTSTTTSTTTAPPGRAAHSQPVRDTTKAEKDDEELDTSKESSSTTTSRPIETRKKATTSQADERRATSVSNFLEPMNKLGPLMNTPTIPSGCVENGRSYAIGEQIPTIEACKHCYCGPEGLKECKMVECEVKGDHDCRPITQAGHCCPIRYECPPASGPKSFDSGQLTQCNSSTGLDNNCRHNETAAPVLKSTRLIDEPQDEPQDELPTPPTANTFSGILEPIGPATDPTQQLQQLNGSMSSLTNELNQFIMRIRANQSSSSDGTAPSGEPAEPDSSSDLSNFNGTRATTTKQDYESVRPPENTITTPQAPPSTSLAYDPLTIPAGMLGIPSIEPETIESLSRNFSDRLEPTLNPFDLTSTPPSTMANIQYANEPTTTLIGDHNSATNQRDARPINGRMLNGNSSGELLGTMLDPSHTPRTFSIVSNPSSTPVATPIEHSTQPVAGNGNMALDLSPGSQLFGRPVMRIANLQASNQPEAMGHTRNLRDESSGARSRTHKPVEFDDDAILSLINNHHSNTASGHQATPLGAGGPPSDQSNNTNYALYAADGVTPEPELGRPTTGTPIGLEAERGLSLGSSWLRLLPQWTRTFGQRLSGFDGFQSAANGQHQDVMTLVAQNQSQADVIDQAGDQSAVASARSNHQNPFMSMLVSIINSNDEQQKQLQAQALQPIRSQPMQPRAANLVMRPLDQAQLVPMNRSVEQIQADSRQALTPIVSSFQQNQQQPRTKPFSPPYEPAVGYSEPEIITAPAPHDEPERLDPTAAAAAADADTKELVVVASSSFARRSDVPSEGGGEDETSAQDSDKTPIVTGHKESDEVRHHSSLGPAPAADLKAIETTDSSRPNAGHRHNEHTTPVVLDQPAKQPALSCFDVATNRTYQLNERIPKADGPCKVCHCILGREICQPHVCPPRPSERCREEHRPGECCPDWLCGDGLTPVSNLGGDLPSGQHADLREPVPMSPPVANNLLQPSQRSLGASQELNVNAPKLSRQLGAGYDRQQANLMTRPNPTNNINFLSSLNSRQLTSNVVQQNQGQQNQFVPNQAQINQFRQLQPQPTSTNQFSQGNHRAEHRTGVEAPSSQPHQHQTNLRSSILPGSSFIGSPILMHPQQFIRQQQQQQQQQNLLRRNDESGPSQMFNSNSIPFSMRPIATDYQAQNNQANAMRFPSTHNAADHRVGSQQPLLGSRPLQQMFASMEHSANNNLPNSQLGLPTNQQVSPPAINGQFLPTALRTVPLFTTSQPRPGPMYSSQLVPIPSPGQRSPLAEQAKAVAHSNGLREVASSQLQPDKILFKQSQMMTPVLDSAGFRPIVRPAQSLTFGSADQSADYSNHVADNSIQATGRFSEKDSGSQTEPTSTRTSIISTTDEPAPTSATASQTPAMSFSRDLPMSAETSGSSPPVAHSEATTSQGSASPIPLADGTLAVTSSDQDESSPTQTSSSRADSSTMTDSSRNDATSTSTFSSPTTTTPTTTTTTTTMSPTSTTTLNSIDYFDSESPSGSGDSGGGSDSLDSFLTFSECNIKGRVYKLGQPIEEESSSCRRCTCTSTGVVCKSEC